jgi:hypothetical protein
MNQTDRDELERVRAALPFDLSHTRQSTSELVAALAADRRMLQELARFAPEALNVDVRVMREKDKQHKLSSAKGGKKGAATRDLKAIDPVRAEELARQLGWPKTTQDIYKRVAVRMDRSPERIGQILRERVKAK